MNHDAETIVSLLIATLGGLAVGLERQRSGHASGRRAHFAGVRTFTLLGGLAGMAGWLWTEQTQLLAALLIGGAVALVIAGYVAAARQDTDGTTEVAALVVLAAGLLSASHYWRLAAGVIAVTTLLLAEKSRLHDLAHRLDDASLRAGTRFAVMAVVILPLLPVGPYGPWGGIRPRTLWMFVLLFSGLSFVGAIAQRVVGAGAGYTVTGMIGGLVSSTNVAFVFSRLSRTEKKLAPALAVGCPFVLKPASYTPVGALMIAEILAETDLPRGAFSVLPCRRDGADLFTTDAVAPMSAVGRCRTRSIAPNATTLKTMPQAARLAMR